MHGSATGGFFRCNIWQEEDDGTNAAEAAAASAASSGDNGDDENDEGFGTAIYSARQQYRKRQEMNRFLHHYTRYEAHDQSAKLERNMAETATTRLAPVVAAAIEFDGSRAFNFSGKGKDVHDDKDKNPLPPFYSATNRSDIVIWQVYLSFIPPLRNCWNVDRR